MFPLEIWKSQERYGSVHLRRIFLMKWFQYHPDVAGNASSELALYLEIKDAYEVLKDEKKRQDYDVGLSRFGPHYGRKKTSSNVTDGPSQTKYNPEHDPNNVCHINAL